MNDRYLGIERAYRSVAGAKKSTYDWIFDRSGPSFVNWLEEGRGIFWINGKAGSGKSTLMKFIKDDPRLKSCLSAAATESKDVVILDFFFWAAGSTEQRSQIGLLKTMLYYILIHAKKLLPIVCPREWEHVGIIASRLVFEADRNRKSLSRDPMRLNIGNNNHLRQVCEESGLYWTRRTLLQIFQDLLTKIPSSTPILLLIDGLDEYEATEQEMEEFVDLLREISQAPNVKICLSTRPWTVFENNFGRGQYPTFQLQHLTHNDIKTFVTDSFDRSKLMQNIQQAYPKQMPDLIENIISKAEGVFLWVRLVVRSLIRGLQNGDELKDLERKVHELPKDLEKLYMHMLERIEPKYWERSAKIFKIISTALELPTALTIWYSGDTEADPLDDISTETKLARCYQVHLRLMNQCAGLLELRYHGRDENTGEDYIDTDLLQQDDSWSLSQRQHYLQSTVNYLHRTTKDFLDKPEIASILSIRISRRRSPFGTKSLVRFRTKGGSAPTNVDKDFDPNQWLARHTLVELKSVTASSPKHDDERELWEMNGFILSRISEAFWHYVLQCQDGEAISQLVMTHEKLLNNIGLVNGADGCGIRVLGCKPKRMENDERIEALKLQDGEKDQGQI